MKIPETSANVGAYYGNDENGQWQTMYLQPNSVVIDNGVGGGVVGSGDAGVRPVYPVHIPRHMHAGYVMAGAYYPPQFAPPVPQQPDDFEDYMWMENEEEFDKQVRDTRQITLREGCMHYPPQFAPPVPQQPDDPEGYIWMENEEENSLRNDKQVIQQLEEEALMEQCIEAMLEDEQRERRGGPRQPRPPRDPDAPTTSTCNGGPGISLEEAVSRSTLNPLAAEFVPTRVRLPPKNPNPPAPADIKAESTDTPSTEEQTEPSRTEAESESTTEHKPQVTEEIKTKESLTPPKDPPEVSAADVQPIQKKPKDNKKPPKIVQEVKKVKPVVVKSETKLPKKKEVKEVKVTKSEVKIEESVNSASEDAVDSVPKLQPPTPTEEAFPGLKPINYAAAAKAMKPKPRPTATPTEKPIEKKEIKPAEKKEVKPAEKKEVKPLERKEVKPLEKKDVKAVRSTPKTNKDRVRKNSTK